MSFDTCDFDLSQFIYGMNDVRLARQFMHELLRDYAPNWQKCPQGAFGALWKTDSIPSALQITDIVHALMVIRSRMTETSWPTFVEKFVQLLSISDRNQFDEHCAELRVARVMAETAGPVWLEPLMSGTRTRGVPRQASPDMAIRILGQALAIEVTAFRVQSIEDWTLQTNRLRERISTDARRRGLNFDIEISAPLGIDASNLTKRSLAELLDQITQNKTGNQTLRLGNNSAEVTWNNFDLEFEELRRRDIYRHIHHLSLRLSTPPAEMEELVIRSMRHTIDGKRRQLSLGGVATLLVLWPASQRLLAPGLLTRVARRIWPNRQYQWLSAIGFLEPIRDYRRNFPSKVVSTNINPNAAIPVSEAMNNWLSGRHTFWDNQQAL